MDDEEPQAHFALAVALLMRRQHERALAEARRCLELAPSLAEGYLAASNILMYAGDPAESIDTIDTYRKLDPHYPEIALYFLAEAQVGIGRLDDAVATLKERLQRNPDSATSHALLASCYGHLGRTEDAHQAWTEVMRISPDYSIERRRRVLPFRDPATFEARIDGLRKAGIAIES